MAATSFDPRQPQIISRNGIPQIIRGAGEDTSETFKAVALVYLDATGQVNEVVTGLTDIDVAGIAMVDAINSNSASLAVAHEVPIQALLPGDILQMHVCDNSGSLEASNTTCAPGVAYDLKDVSGLHYVNSADTSKGGFIFVEPVKSADGSASSLGRFIVKYTELSLTGG
jgi:hypothetical protein